MGTRTTPGSPRRGGRAAAGATTAVTVAALLAACGFVNTDDGGGGEQGGGSVSAYVNTEQNAGLTPLAEAYQEETGTSVDITSADTDEFNQQLRVQLTSGTAADLIRVSPGYSSPVAAGVLGGEGALADISDSDWTADLSADTRPLAEVDGEVVAFPVSRNAITMAYNEKVFADAGVEVPTTWPELLDACKTLADQGVTPIAAPFEGGIFFQFWVYALASTLVYADDPEIDARMADGETSFVDDAGWNEVFAKIAELNDAGYFTEGMLGVPQEHGMQAVATGDAAMILLVSAGLPQLFEYHESGADAFGLFALPATDDAAATHLPLAPDLLAVNADADNPEGARGFLDHVAQPENVEEYANAMGVLPGLEVDVDLKSDVLDPLTPLLDEGRTTGYANYLWPNGDVQQTMLQSGQEWLLGSIDTANLLGQMDTEYAKGKP